MTSKGSTTTSSSRKTKTPKKTPTKDSKKDRFPGFRDTAQRQARRRKIVAGLRKGAKTKNKGALDLLLALVEEQLRLQDYHEQLLKKGVPAELLSRAFAQPSKMLLKLLEQLGLATRPGAGQSDDDEDELGFD